MLNKKKEEIYMNYTTQMDAAKKGIITPEMEIVAKKENITAEELRERKEVLRLRRKLKRSVEKEI